MASNGNNTLLKGIPSIGDAFIVIVKTEWNSKYVDELEKGCLNILNSLNIKTKTITVPGAVEIPFAIQRFAKTAAHKADAFIALGTVVKGDTPHFDYVCNAVTNGIVLLNNELSIPTIFGILTVLNEQQIIERLGGKHGHKGEEAAITALKMIAFNQSLLVK
ncbi:MAG: 6,7-dimethyl-8-ribityllumazine synthase [Chitinophagaceae bacterium]